MRKYWILLAWCIFLTLSSSPSYAELGPHGGAIQGLAPYKNSLLLSGRWVELVEESKPDSRQKKYRVRVFQKNGDPVNLMHSGYWAVFWHSGDKQGQLQDNVAAEKQRTWKEKPPYTPLDSFLAWGEVPEEKDLKIEVVIALPSKGGTGIATFSPK